MPVSPRPFQIAALTFFAALSLLVPASAAAIEGGAKSTVLDRRAESRMEVVVDGNATAAHRIALSDRIGRDLMAYRFRVEAVNEFGATIEMPAAVVVTLRVGALGANSEVRFTHDLRDLTLPRPWAIRLGADDSLVVWIDGSEAASAASFRLIIDYEPVDRFESRMAVTSVRTDAQATEGGRVESLEWRAATNGRLLAMTGLPLDRVEAIVLTDIESGVTLWSTDVRGPTTGGSAQAGAALRLGVPVTAGRRYRLSVTFSATARTAMEPHSVVAMVLPAMAR